jgi:hypothetical protein
MYACQHSLELLVNAHKWDRRIASTTGNTATEIDRGRLLFKTSIKRFPWEDNKGFTVYIDLELRPFSRTTLGISNLLIKVSDDGDCSEFLTMKDFLDYTQLVVVPRLSHGQICSSHKNRCWEIVNPASIIKLFRMFDSVSETFCKQQVFCLPK